MTEFNPCNANADCAPNSLTVTCACQAGYTGDGMGADGCTMIEVPQAQPQSQPQAKTPSGKLILLNLLNIMNFICTFSHLN
jgi:hypothetical protein